MRHTIHYIYVMRFGDVLSTPFFQERYPGGIYVYITRTFPRKDSNPACYKTAPLTKICCSVHTVGRLYSLYKVLFFFVLVFACATNSFYRKGTNCLGLRTCKLLSRVTMCILQSTSIVQCNFPGVVYLWGVTIMSCIHRRGIILNVHYYLMDGLETRELLLRTTCYITTG